MKRIIATSLAVAAFSLGLFGCSSTGTTGSATPAPTIVFVWDWPAASVPNTSSSTSGLSFQSPLDPGGAVKDTSLAQGSYAVNLAVKNLSQGAKTYTYFDSAKVTCQ